MDHDESQLAEAVRRAVIDALIDAYEDAGVRGLCADGRFEAAVSAARSIDLRATIACFDAPPSESTRET